MLRVVRSNIRLIGCKKQFPLYKMEAAATISNATKMLGGRDDSGGSYSGYIMAIVITGAYLLLRYLDIRYIQKKEIVGKDLFREGVILYIACEWVDFSQNRRHRRRQLRLLQQQPFRQLFQNG